MPSSRRAARALAAAAHTVALLLAVLAAPGCSTTGGLPSQGFAPAVQRALPATVGIYAAPVSDDSMDGDPVHPPHIGAGFLVDVDGVVATAAHLLAGTALVVVRSADGRIARGEPIAIDEELDIALLRVPRDMLRLPAFGRSQALRPGDWVLAIGEPFGLGRSVTAGIVGGLERHFAEDDEATFIQSDVAINPGNSGGPLLDRSGAVVGMNLRVVSSDVPSSGVTLSLPIETVLQFARQPSGSNPSQRPHLQAEFGDLPPLTAIARGHVNANGALVRLVEPGGCADLAGLRVGDVVLAFDGLPVRDGAELARRLRGWRPAALVRLLVVRGQQRLELILSAPTPPQAGLPSAASSQAAGPRAPAGTGAQSVVRGAGP